MMLGIFLSLLAMIFTVYIPNWAKSGEANHMDGVLESFMEFKSNIDKQITTEKDVGSTLSTRIKLGSVGGAVMGIGRTTGSLYYHSTQFSIILNNTDDPQNIYGQTSGMMTYKSRNIYYPNQYFTFENGAVIVEQGNSAILRAKPNLDITYNNNQTSLIITLIQLSGASHSVDGVDTHTIDTTLIQSIAQSYELIWTPEEGFEYGQNITINITTKFGTLWQKHIDSELDELPSNVRNNTVDVYALTSSQDPSTGETFDNIILKLKEIDKLNCKKGVVEIKLN